MTSDDGKASGNPYEPPAAETRPSRRTRDSNVLLVSCVSFAAVFLSYPVAWGINPWLAFALVVGVTVVAAFLVDWAQNVPGFVRAVGGGSLGGILGVVCHFAWAYAFEQPFEDDDLGFFMATLVFAPFGAGVGLGIGIVLWTLGLGSLLARCRRSTNED